MRIRDRARRYMADGNEWLKCLECGFKLVPVGVKNGRTGIHMSFFGFQAWVDRMEVVCPNCGRERRFCSVPVKPQEHPLDAGRPVAI